MSTPAPNRPLDLSELGRPPYKDILEKLEALTARESRSYLHPSKRWEYPWALERAALAPGSRVLDAGCGASIFPIYLAKHGHEVTGLDLRVPYGLDAEHGVQVEYVEGNLTELPFPDEYFDAVFCISVIEHLGLDGIPRALDELRRVTRRNGLVLLTTDYYEDAGAQLWYEGPGRSFPVEWSVFDEDQLRRYIVEAPGLQVDGELDLQVDWETVRPAMRRYHGYPYTAVGVALIRL